MRLVDLEPEWLRWQGREGVGIRFWCPCCADCVLAVLFQNPLDGGAPVPAGSFILGENDGRRWTRSGTSFEDLSLTPSIHATSHWHGFITGGQVL